MKKGKEKKKQWNQNFAQAWLFFPDLGAIMLHGMIGCVSIFRVGE